MAAALRLATLAAAAVIFIHVAAADIVNGSSRADVINELGKPSSQAKREAREVLIYPKNVRIELENGVVVDIKGYVPASAPAPVVPATPEKTKAEPASTAARPTPQPAPAPTGTPTTAKPAAKGTNPPPAEYSPAAGANLLGDEVAKMDTAWGPAPKAPPKPKPPGPLQLAVGLVLHFVLTVVALRLAFKYWEMDAFWSGTFAIAGIDAAIRVTLEALSPITQGFTTLGHVDTAIAWFVMIGTIRHFCFNKRLQSVILTASFVKGVVTTIYIFVSIALRGALFH